jgi:hypothetical protein
MERLGWWLCAGLSMLGAQGSDETVDGRMRDEAGADREDGWFGAVLHESRIAYPLVVDAWQAVGEHLFDDEEDGVCVRYVHGSDRDRWIDVYFYPAGPLSEAQFVQAARSEAELIRDAHLQAGYSGFDMGRLRSFSFTGGNGMAVDGHALDLAYAIDGVRYSSAMTLLLDRLYFIKARYSVQASTLARRQAREQLQAFSAHLQSRVAILSVGDHDAAGRSFPSRSADALGGDGWPGAVPADMREIRLEYRRPQAHPSPVTTVRTAELSAG